MIYLSIIIFTLWRRWLGAWNTGPRWVKVLVLVVAMLGQASVSSLYMEGMVSVLLAMIYFLPCHNYGETKPVLLRYGPGGIGYVIAKRFKDKLPTFPPIIDGWSAYGELWVGATFGLFYSLVFQLLTGL